VLFATGSGPLVPLIPAGTALVPVLLFSVGLWYKYSELGKDEMRRKRGDGSVRPAPFLITESSLPICGRDQSCGCRGISAISARNGRLIYPAVPESRIDGLEQAAENCRAVPPLPSPVPAWRGLERHRDGSRLFRSQQTRKFAMDL